MATPAGQFRPGRLIAIFGLITALLYALVFFTPGSRSPKLGIDLQGGTRITLTASTDAGTPSRDSMNQARQIMETRVNGSGVVGAQVQIDGSNQLVVTVPGNQDLSGLTRTAQLNIRPQLAFGCDSIAQYASTGSGCVSLAGVTTSSGTSSGTGGSSSSSPAPTTAPAIGDTVTSGAVVGPASSTPKSSGSPAVGSTRTSTAASSPKTGSAAGSASSTAAATSSQGLRRAAAATTTAGTGTSTAGTGTSAAQGTGTGAGSSSAAASSTAAAGSGTPTSGSGTTAASGTATTAGWPIAGSDPKNPNQPAGADATAWSAWQTAAQAAVTAGTVSCANLKHTAGTDVPDKPLLACGSDTDPGDVYLLDKTLIPGDQIDNAAAMLDASNGNGWIINVSFKSDGFKTWSNYTTNNVGAFTAFTLDGQVLSSPRIQGAITTVVTQVTGTFTQASATALANSLKFGALPLHFDQAENQSVSAQLGLEYLRAGLIAGGIGLLLVVLYCLLYYRLLGVITILSLVLSFGLVYGIMVLLGRWISLSLDMAGIAGLIVAIGITADSFVIYFERLKDEVREGRSFRSAVPRGWERARRTILSADAVSFLSALVLYLVAVGDVRGFAFTLGLSTVLDLVVVFLVTHPLVALASGAKIFQSARFSGLGATAEAGAQQRAAAAKMALKEA